MVRIGAAISTLPDARAAGVAAAIEARGGERGRAEPDLAVLFGSMQHAEHAEALLDGVHEAVRPAAVLGCIGESVVGGAREIESEPAVSVWLGWLGAETATYRLSYDPEADVLAGVPEDPGTHLVIADPYTFPADRLLDAASERGVTVVGGLASGGVQPGTTRLFRDREVLDHGAVGARLPEGSGVRALVSQGCRPIGPPMVVTAAHGNVIEGLAGVPPLQRLREVWAGADERDRELLSRGLQIGRVVDEYAQDPGRGDYLIRAVLGADRGSGAMIVGDEVRVGETVRFHVRDARSADEDLRELLEGVPDGAAGGLLFTCNGRGSRLFETPDHDARMISERIASRPLAGFFCAGELGPVGDRSFLHGFTASLALFYD